MTAVEGPPPKGRSLRIGAVVALLAGLALLTGLIAWVGWRPVLKAVTSVGWGGFALFVGYWLIMLCVLGLAWFAGAPSEPYRRAPGFIWGRMVREGASDVLPFSQIGGLVIGVQTVVAQGVPEAVVMASTVMDLTTEMFAQVVYTLLGVMILAMKLSGSGAAAGALMLPMLVVLLVILGTAAFVAIQRRGISAMGWLAQRFLPDGAVRGEAVAEELGRIYEKRGHMAAGAALHLTGWIGASFGSWIGLKLMGVELPLSSVIAIEAVMFTARSIGFAVPGALGVQEGAYLIAGPLMGLHGDTAVALSLLKRARDLVIGVPVLIVWQALESRRLLRAAPTSTLTDAANPS